MMNGWHNVWGMGYGWIIGTIILVVLSTLIFKHETYICCIRHELQ
jgi:hypothetical protein